MLRVDNGNVLENSSNIKYASRPVDKCVTRRQEYDALRKAHCAPVESDSDKLNNMHRQSACSVHYCMPMKKCMAKVGLHDSNGNFLTQSLISANQDMNHRNITNQIGYVYQEKTLVDNDALINALRNDKVIPADLTYKIQESTNQLYGKPHAWDGTDTGFFCPVECPERKDKPCARSTCKKGDPIFHPEMGIGSDAMEAKRDLREINAGRNFQARLETAPMIRQATTATTGVGAGVGTEAPRTAEVGVGETMSGRPLAVGGNRGRPRGSGIFGKRDKGEF